MTFKKQSKSSGLTTKYDVNSSDSTETSSERVVKSSSEAVANKSSKPPGKPKGAKHAPRKAIERAILGGAKVNYKDLAAAYGASESTVAKVVKELVSADKLIKYKRTYKLKG